GNSYSLVLDDATNSAGLTVNASSLAAPNYLYLDGSAETSSGLTAIGGAGNDSLTGGDGNDTLIGGAGGDWFNAGTGNDVLSGGAGNDIFAMYGNLTAADRIDGGTGTDTVNLAGDYS